MARVCQYCGKRTQVGNSVTTRGKPKYLGGVGTKITGITRRKFKPNLQSVKVVLEDGSNRSVRVCTQCLRTGVVDRAVKRRAFELTS
jgi:large subunit ribosomal protein L28